MRLLSGPALALLIGLGAGCQGRGGEAVPAAPTPAPAPTDASAASASPAPAPAAAPAFDKLVARWQREDGGYILEIRSVSPQGRVDASYYNPRPIHVAKAEAFTEAGVVTVFVELRAPNYPGSTYRLVYDPSHDALVGTYFQALEGQTFDVSFVRR